MVAPWCLMGYEGRFELEATPAAVWAAIEEMDQFEGWWSWLGNLEVDGGLRTGAVLRGTVAPPVPYRMRIRVDLIRCVPRRLVDAQVSGDLVGPARLRLRAAGDGTVAEVGWDLEMRQRPMRLAGRVAYPLLRWGHDRVVEATVRGFRSQLARRPPGQP